MSDELQHQNGHKSPPHAEDRGQGRSMVEVEYNGETVLIHRGHYTAKGLREELGVKDGYVLEQYVDGHFEEVIGNKIVIRGGEEFADHLPQGGAS